LEEFKKILVAFFLQTFCPPFKLVIKAKFFHGKTKFFTTRWVSKNGFASNAH